MRNFISALIALNIGSLIVMGLASQSYPEPFELVAFLLSGSVVLMSLLETLLSFRLESLVIVAWLIMGLIVGITAESKWNSIRTVVWIGVMMAILDLASMFLNNPALWSSNQVERNILIIMQLIKGQIIGLFTLITALPVIVLIGMFRRPMQIEPKPIMTVCECGAVFKSRPAICSECGRVLHDEIDTCT